MAISKYSFNAIKTAFSNNSYKAQLKGCTPSEVNKDAIQAKIWTTSAPATADAIIIIVRKKKPSLGNKKEAIDEPRYEECSDKRWRILHDLASFICKPVQQERQ